MPITVDVTMPPYSATGDGETDDAQAIQDAINYVSSHVDPDPEDDTVHEGGTVWIPEGIYLIESTMVVSKH